MNGADDESKPIAIRTYGTRLEADLVRGRLESEGIPAWVSTDDAGGVYPFQLGDGAHVMVRAQDGELAERVLGDDAS